MRKSVEISPSSASVMVRNKIKWKRFSARRSLANHLRRLPEMNCRWRKCCLASCGLGKISFPLNFSSCSNLLPFLLLSFCERAPSCGGEICAKIIYVPWGRLPVALRRYMNKHCSEEAPSRGFFLRFPSRQQPETLERHLNFFFSGGKKRRQRFLKSKLKTRDNFYFVCFLFCLIWFWAFRLIYWFIIFGCKVFWPRFLWSFSSVS